MTNLPRSEHTTRLLKQPTTLGWHFTFCQVLTALSIECARRLGFCARQHWRSCITWARFNANCFQKLFEAASMHRTFSHLQPQSLKWNCNINNEWQKTIHDKQWHTCIILRPFIRLTISPHVFTHLWGEHKWHRCFYGLHVLPVTQPTVSKHRKKHKALSPTSGLVLSFPHPPPNLWQTGTAPFMPAFWCQHHRWTNCNN